MSALARSLSLFSIVPVRVRPELTADEARRALLWLPAVGLALGAAAALPLVAAREWAAHAGLVAAFVAVGLLTLLTRALHLDGLADTADGLGSRAPAPRALEIMRQSDIGPFGVLAIVFVVGLEVSAVSSVPHGPWAACSALAVAAMTGRLAAVHASFTPAARPDGFGALVHRTDGRATVVVVTLVVFALGALLGRWWWPLVQAVALGVAEALRRHCTRRLGGTTGDVYGALIETATAVTLAGLALR